MKTAVTLMVLCTALLVDGFLAPDFISPWYDISPNGTSEYIIDVEHGLGSLPIKVDVQVRIDEASEFVFPGITSVQQQNASFPRGGVLYLYSETNIKLIASSLNDSNIFAIFTGGDLWEGVSKVQSATAQVRVRAWSACLFPMPYYVSDWQFISSKKAEDSYKRISYSNDADWKIPLLATVQVKLQDGAYKGWVVDGTGGVMTTGSRNISGEGAVLFAFSGTTVKIWTPFSSDGQGCIFSTWDNGDGDQSTEGMFRISVWRQIGGEKAKSSHLMAGEEAANEVHEITLDGSVPVDINSAIVTVEAKPTAGSDSQYSFYGTGAVQESDELGAVVYAYSGNAVRTWTPVITAESDRYLVFVPETWGDGKTSVKAKNAMLKVRVWKPQVIISEFEHLPENDCGPGKCYTSDIGFTCNCNGTGHQGKTCSDAIPNCGAPPDEPFTDVTGLGHFEGDEVTYTCQEGYSSEAESVTITCFENETWSEANISCEVVSCGDPSDFNNTYLEANDITFGSVAAYTCVGENPLDNNTYMCQWSNKKDEIANECRMSCQADGTWSRQADVPICISDNTRGRGSHIATCWPWMVQVVIIVFVMPLIWK